MFVILHTCPGELNHQRKLCRRIQCENIALRFSWCVSFCPFSLCLVAAQRHARIYVLHRLFGVHIPIDTFSKLNWIRSEWLPVRVWPAKNVWTIDTLHPWRSFSSHFSRHRVWPTCQSVNIQIHWKRKRGREMRLLKVQHYIDIYTILRIVQKQHHWNIATPYSCISHVIYELNASACVEKKI